MKSEFRPRAKQTPENQGSYGRASYSYYSNTGSKRIQPEGTGRVRVGRYIRLLPAFIAGAVIVISVLVSLTLSTYPAVDTLREQASPYRKTDDYARYTDKVMRDNLSSRTKLTINTKDIEQKLLEEFPELRSVALRLPVLGRRPTLVVDIRQPALMLSTDTQSFVLDKQGVAVSELRNLGADYRQGVPAIRDQSGIELRLGKQALASDTVEFVETVIAQIKAKNLNVSQLTLPASANELDIYIEGLNYFVKTDTSGDARLQVGSFLAVHEHLSGQGTTPSEYIDVRVEERAFYK